MNELTVRLSAESAKPEIPAIRWNKEECEKALDEMLQGYTNVVYTEEQVKTAKADRAAVNKIVKQLGDARKAVKAIYLEPVALFESDVKELEAKAKRVSDAIDKQAKDFEMKSKEARKQELLDYYNSHIGDLEKIAPFDSIMEQSWLNKSSTMKYCTMQMEIKIQSIWEQLNTITEICGDNVDACTAEYVRSGYRLESALHLNKQIEDAKTAREAEERRRKLEEAARAAAPVIVPKNDEEQHIQHCAEASTIDKEFIKPEEPEQAKAYDFRVWATREQINALRQFLTTAEIKYGKVR